jgi:hypothetical protein
MADDWTPAFEGQRPPFQPGNDLAFKPGNTLSRTHGSYGRLSLAPRAQALADEIRQVVPLHSPADEPAIAALALILAQLERASIALAQADELLGEERSLAAYTDRTQMFERLRADARGWANTARRYFNDLGMTPTSRAKLGLNVARGRGEALRLHLAERYGDGEDA